jgi:hypothetical protein
MVLNRMIGGESNPLKHATLTESETFRNFSDFPIDTDGVKVFPFPNKPLLEPLKAHACS